MLRLLRILLAATALVVLLPSSGVAEPNAQDLLLPASQISSMGLHLQSSDSSPPQETVAGPACEAVDRARARMTRDTKSFADEAWTDDESVSFVQTAWVSSTKAAKRLIKAASGRAGERCDELVLSTLPDQPDVTADAASEPVSPKISGADKVLGSRDFVTYTFADGGTGYRQYRYTTIRVGDTIIALETSVTADTEDGTSSVDLYADAADSWLQDELAALSSQ